MSEALYKKTKTGTRGKKLGVRGFTKQQITRGKELGLEGETTRKTTRKKIGVKGKGKKPTASDLKASKREIGRKRAIIPYAKIPGYGKPKASFGVKGRAAKAVARKATKKKTTKKASKKAK